MSKKFHLATAGNVLVPAYLALKQKGFRVWCVKSSSDTELETWYAEDEGRHFCAEDPLSLLGLVAIQETCGYDWEATDEEIDAFFNLA
jgi:hypothetical protein